MADRITTLFFELFSGLPRQGPGDAASTVRALSLMPDVGPGTRVLDIGCGTGAQTLVLAQNSPAHFVAVDNHPPFVEALRRQAQGLGLDHRIEARVADMRQLDFPAGAFDAIWCEGAIYIVGVESALREWRRLLVPAGHIAFTEVCWTTPNPPAECAGFWAAEYPAIREVPAVLAAIDGCGYDTVGHFALPASAWWDDYYRPLQPRVHGFRARHRDEADAEELADQVQREIDVWRAYSDFYGYHFFTVRAR